MSHHFGVYTCFVRVIESYKNIIDNLRTFKLYICFCFWHFQDIDCVGGDLFQAVSCLRDNKAKCLYTGTFVLYVSNIVIECFTTTFLRTHSWLNWVDEDDDEDEVGLTEKPEDTRYIKKITSK